MPGRIEQPLQRALGLVTSAVVVTARKIALDVFDRALQHVEAIPQRLQLVARDDELVLPETEVGRASTRLVVALAARISAIQPRPARS